MAKKVIGNAEIQASYKIARQWLAGDLTRSQAVTKLSDDHGLNAVSAGDLLQALNAIFRGESFTRSISAAAAEYYVNSIAQDDGSDAAARAVRAIELHVSYYESVQPSKMRKMRDTLAKLKSEIGLLSEQSLFEVEVAHFKAMSVEMRRQQLPAVGHKPVVKLVQVKTYVRSTAVVAEVLIRAAGNCESCKQPAPFFKSSNGEPYLEVHHMIQLSHGGDDTVSNAIAVCPNCHRKHHFG